MAPGVIRQHHDARNNIYGGSWVKNWTLFYSINTGATVPFQLYPTCAIFSPSKKTRNHNVQQITLDIIRNTCIITFICSIRKFAAQRFDCLRFFSALFFCGFLPFLRRCLHDTGATFIPVRVHSSSLLWLCIPLHDTNTKSHTRASHTGASSSR